MSAVKRVFCSGVATAPLKQARSSPTVMPVGGILERTSSPVGKGALGCCCWVVGSVVGGCGGRGEGPMGGKQVSCLCMRFGCLEGRERERCQGSAWDEVLGENGGRNIPGLAARLVP